MDRTLKEKLISQIKEIVGITLKKLKHHYGDKSDEAFGARFDLPKQTINRYMNGETLPTADILYLLAQKGISINWFLSNKGDMFVQEEYSMVADESHTYKHKRKSA